MTDLSPAMWLALFVGGLAILVLLRIPVAIALLTVSSIGAVLLYGFSPGIEMTVVSMVSGLTTFTLTAVPMFILMGELLFRSGVAFSAIGAAERGLARLPGRLAFLSVGMGAVLGVLSGSVMASTAMLAGTLAPEMERRGYSRRLATGSILGSGGLAMVLPPSTVVIVWGATAGVPVGPLLIAGVVPGVLMAVGYAVVVGAWAYFFGGAERPAVLGKARVRQGQHQTPEPSSGTAVSTEDSRGSLVNLVALVGMIVGVLALILFGIATPTEAAAVAVGLTALILLVQRRLTREVLRESIKHTLLSTGMVFLIIAGATIYGRVMAGSGTVTAFVDGITSVTGNPTLLLVIMLATVIVLGLFLEAIAIVLLTIPLFMPIVQIAGFDPLWFGILMIIAIQIGTVTPPFGMSLFVIRQYAPKSMPMSELYRAAVPFVLSDLTIVVLLVLAPSIVTALPALM
ncbi:tripartite ATP-independent transporter DctM subunit [Tamaricihabitans halophyticus]|uniref:Tripartite ATP-independent transporter DctM subunit n=1 Tax=Tamaricihabitans halophyticus TaxID=1262583 RepID=A0A4R2QT28_9PSEU|nr:TRAP transporter large permease subunit [Tamaricihabitans halophyticus]TCP53073.1 tripartite ATP-independent transporter DctM subunit [Tamaricihabitans halophyticus]